MNTAPVSASCSPVGRSLPHPLLVLAASVLLAACGNDPPTACGTVDDIELFVQEHELVTVCFEDPEMGEITLSVASSDNAVATASASGADQVRVRAVSVGSATITVTAADPEMQTATATFGVEVPNQAPLPRGDMPDVQVVTGGSGVWVLSSYFYEPDGQEMTYSVSLSQQGIVSVSQSADTAFLTASAEGTVTATVTATDPLGLSATQQAMVTVADPPRLIEDEFDTEASLANWELHDSSEATVEGGMFRLHNVVSGYLGLALAEVSAVEWRVTASMGNATDSAWAALIVGAEHARFSAYQIQIGADGNAFGIGETDYRFLIFDADDGPTGRWFVDPDEWVGQSSEIGDIDDLTEVTMAVQGGVLTVHAGSAELVRIDFAGTVLSPNATFLALATWPSGNSTHKTGFFDWVWMDGFDPEEDLMAATWLRDIPGLAEPLLRPVGVKGILQRDMSDLKVGKPVPNRPTRRE